MEELDVKELETAETKEETKETEVSQEVSEEVQAEEPKQEEAVLDEEALQIITNIADKLVEKKDPNSFYFASLGFENKQLFCTHLLGYCYYKGLGVEKNLDDANLLFNSVSTKSGDL